MEKKFKPLEEWAENFKTIGHPIRLAMLFMLYGSEAIFGEHCLTLGQIREILGLPNTKRAENTLTYHLTQLIKNRFVEREAYQAEKGVSRIDTVYRISEQGKKFLEDFKLTNRIDKFVAEYSIAKEGART